MRLRNNLIRLKDDFISLGLFDKIFDTLVFAAMVTVTVIQVVTKDDYFKTLQLCLNIAASLALFIAHILFREGSLFGSLSLKCQKYINVVVLLGSLGGQFFVLGDYYSNYDTLTHFVASPFVCLIAYYIYEFYAKEEAFRKPLLCSTYCFYMSLSVGILWEVFEFCSDFLLGGTCQGYNLSLGDDKFFYFRWFTSAAKPELQYALYDTFADIIGALITTLITAVIMTVVLKKKQSAYGNEKAEKEVFSGT